MKCGYTNCKESYELTKENGVKVSTKWYHKECERKRSVKSEITSMFPWFVKRDLNIALKKAIDDNGNDADFVLFVVKTAASKLDSPYKILYHLKIDDYKKQYHKKLEKQLCGSVDKYVRENGAETTEEVDFKFQNYKKPKWLEIY